MISDAVPYTIFPLVSAIATLSLALYAFSRQWIQGGNAFGMLMVCCSTWAMGYAALISNPVLPAARFWYNFAQIGTALLPFAWLWLALEYQSARSRSHRILTIAALVIPVIHGLLHFMNDESGLLYQSFDIVQTRPVAQVVIQNGSLANVMQAYAFLGSLAALVVLTRAVRSPVRDDLCFRLKRTPSNAQVWILAIGILVQLGAVILDGSEVISLKIFGPISLLFPISGILAAWGLFRHQPYDLAPIARDTVMESTSAGIIVVDEKERMIDINPAGQKILQFLLPMENQPPGGENNQAKQPIQHLLANYPDAASHSASKRAERFQFHCEDAAQTVYDFNISPLNSHNRHIGSVIVITDISEQVRTEKALRSSEENYRYLAETLRQSEALYHNLIDASPDGIAIITLEGVIVYASPSFHHILGFPGTIEMVDTNICQFLPLEEQDRFRRFLNELVFPHQTATNEFCFLKNQAVNIACDVHARIISSSESVIGQIILVARDVTARKVAETQLQETLEELTQFNQAMVGRELRMIQLKEEVNQLLVEQGASLRYRIPDHEATPAVFDAGRKGTFSMNNKEINHEN